MLWLGWGYGQIDIYMPLWLWIDRQIDIYIDIYHYEAEEGSVAGDEVIEFLEGRAIKTFQQTYGYEQTSPEIVIGIDESPHEVEDNFWTSTVTAHDYVHIILLDGEFFYGIC